MRAAINARPIMIRYQHMMHNWRSFFPFETPRPEQVKAIDFILDAFLGQKKRIVMCNLATGTGKSGIAIAVAKYLDSLPKKPQLDGDLVFQRGAYILTTQKTLQDQYISDFGGPDNSVCTIKSSSNYQCHFLKGQTCGETLRIARYESKGSSLFNACVINCCYKRAKQEFIESQVGVTNFPYFLAETRYAGKLVPRELLVIDECHNAIQQLSSHVEVTISERFARTILRLQMPQSPTQFQAFKWIRDTYHRELRKHVEDMRQLIESLKEASTERGKLKSLAKQFEMLDKHECKVSRFIGMHTTDNWVMNEIAADGKSARKLEFKPVDVGPFAESSLLRFGEHTLMMSATILDKHAMCTMLGINPDDVAYLDIPSPFPEENRQVLFSPVGSMSQSCIEDTLPKLAEAVKLILDAHKGEKGVIHAQTYKIARYLKKHVKSNRLLLHTPDNREATLKKHITSKRATVLISPSMTEGIDLRDDTSRFQVICKVAYPYLGDKIVRKRMHRHDWWYAYETAKTMIQALGRSVRNETDHAVSYILDADFGRFYTANRGYFPQEFDRLLKR